MQSSESHKLRFLSRLIHTSPLKLLASDSLQWLLRDIKKKLLWPQDNPPPHTHTHPRGGVCRTPAFQFSSCFPSCYFSLSLTQKLNLIRYSRNTLKNNLGCVVWFFLCSLLVFFFLPFSFLLFVCLGCQVSCWVCTACAHFLARS
jgi:hypothetical protein